MVKFLSGKKTYILVGLGLVAALVQFLSSGDFSAHAWVEFFHTEAVTAAIAALRAGVAKA